MYNIILQANPTKSHVHHDVYGATFVNSWINTNSKNKALKTLETYLTEQNLELIEIIESSEVKEMDINNDVEKLELFCEAQKRYETYQLYQTPKYSTLLTKYIVKKYDVEQDVLLEFWVDVDYLSNKIDPFQPAYWKNRTTQNILNKVGEKLIKSEGFKLVELISINGLERITGDDNRKKYQDDVDEYGYSMIFKKLSKR